MKAALNLALGLAGIAVCVLVWTIVLWPAYQRGKRANHVA